MNQMLTIEYTSEEVKAAFDNIRDLKAPGPDGMSVVLYKRFWRTVGEAVVHEVLCCKTALYRSGGMKLLLHSS